MTYATDHGATGVTHTRICGRDHPHVTDTDRVRVAGGMDTQGREWPTKPSR
jgi:hypothetical protein